MWKFAVVGCLILCLFFFLVVFRKSTQDLNSYVKGPWYYFSKSGDYNEVYFGDSTLFYFSEDFYFVAPYVIDSSDTLRANVPGGALAFKLRIESANSFSADASQGATLYFKLPDTIFSRFDRGRLFRMQSDDKVFHDYQSDFYFRMDYLKER